MSNQTWLGLALHLGAVPRIKIGLNIMVAKRRFIRLNEITEKTHLTEGDVLDVIESGHMRFCANIEADDLGAISTIDDNRKVVSIFNYNGVVGLRKDDSKKLAISSKALAVREFIILEPENISYWRKVTDAFNCFESANFYYTEKAFKQPNHQILAYSRIASRRTIENVVGGWVDTFSKALTPEKAQALKEQIPKSDSLYLDTMSKMIEINRLRIDLDDIAKIFGNDALKYSGCLAVDSESLVNSDTKALPSKLIDGNNGAETISVIFTHPIEQIVHRIIVADPSLKADKIWVLIRKDVNQEGQRIYDIDYVIDEMTADSVAWFGKGESLDNEMSYESFRKSTVYRVKKRLKEEAKN
jgi:hypothetical protein